MKLKYYLRGAGLGVIVATLILTVSSALHDSNISDEEIIKRASKLGMVMAETETESEAGLFGDAEDTTSSENESEQISEQTSETETELETETEEVVDTQDEIPEGTLITFTIDAGEYPRTVSEKLFAAGLIDDAEAFRVYVGEKKRGQNLIVGTFQIPMGATYDEILDIITFK